MGGRMATTQARAPGAAFPVHRIPNLAPLRPCPAGFSCRAPPHGFVGYSGKHGTLSTGLVVCPIALDSSEQCRSHLVGTTRQGGNPLRPLLMLLFLLAALLIIVSIWQLWLATTAPLGGGSFKAATSRRRRCAPDTQCASPDARILRRGLPSHVSLPDLASHRPRTTPQPLVAATHLSSWLVAWQIARLAAGPRPARSASNPRQASPDSPVLVTSRRARATITEPEG